MILLINAYNSMEPEISISAAILNQGRHFEEIKSPTSPRRFNRLIWDYMIIRSINAYNSIKPQLSNLEPRANYFKVGRNLLFSKKIKKYGNKFLHRL